MPVVQDELEATQEVVEELSTIIAEQTRRVRHLEAALKTAQSAIALCFSEGGTFSAGDATPWWTKMIEAQQGIAAALRKAS